MFSQKWERREVVVEAGHAVMTVMTSQAAFSEIADMLGYKGLIVICMASGAFSNEGGEIPFKYMASGASHLLPFVIKLVPFEAKLSD